MAAKRVDPLKAKEAKQKKIAIGGAILLVALLAFQGPKTIKMLKGPQPVTPPAAAPAPATPAPGATPAAAPTAAGGTAAGSVPAAPADLASVPNSDPAPEAEQGQLVVLGRFESKDPFAQQAQPLPKPVAAEKPEAKEPEAPKPAPAAPPATDGFTTGGTTTTGGTGTPVPTAPPAAPVELASATSIAVNGVAEDVKVDVPFPVAEPTFVLVSIAADGKSVEIGIAGGEYAGGGETLKLALGKKVTLQNTADGSRYELELRSIEGRPLPKKG